MRLMLAFYILFSVVFDSCHAIEEIDFAQNATVSQADSQPTISDSHDGCGTTHPASETQPHHCHSTHCTFLLDPQVRIALADTARLQTDYLFFVPQSSAHNLRRPPKAQA